MAFSVEYFHARVLAEIESWPVDVLADYARIVELLVEHGPNLKLPYSRAFGDGLFEIAASWPVRYWSGVLLLPCRKTRSDTPRLYQEIATSARTRNQARPKATEGDSKWLI